MNAERSLPVDREILERIQAAKDKLGQELVILAHFYQHDDIVRFADFVGDSLQLAQAASNQKDAKYVVFCAVSFMAEMARILCLPQQQVFHPEPQAQCPLAGMASIDDVETAWSILKETGKTIIPIVYVNSKADLKAFCGKNGGFVCTSANAKKAMEHVLSRKAVPFFFPDENLGKNTARIVGVADDEMYTWEPDGIVSRDNLKNIEDKKVILWKGFCYVHTGFLVSHVEALRKIYNNDIKIIVHPECLPDVVRCSDLVGSTSFIKNNIEKAPSGSRWAIGTEIHFVDRMKRDNPDKHIIPLGSWMCHEMSKVTAVGLLGVLEGIVEKRQQPAVTVHQETEKFARIALNKMLEIG
jgi:quinolinate synthase